MAVIRTFLSAMTVVVAVAAAQSGAGALQSSTRTFHLSAFDDKGRMVPDLQPADIIVKAGGKLLEVIRTEQAVAPLRIAVIVSDAGTGGFQQGIASFVQRLIDRAEFGLVSVLPQPEVVTNFTSDAAVLREGVRRLGVRGRQNGAQVMEAIQDATKGVVSEGRRAVILVLRVGVEGTTRSTGATSASVYDGAALCST